MSFIDYENLNNKNNNDDKVLLRVPKGLILITSEEIVSNPESIHTILKQEHDLHENKAEPEENNCKMLNESVYNKFYDIMLANKRKPSVTRKKKPNQKKKSKSKNKTRNNKK